ncbi:hypothetical protein [Bradyrhizobium sp.]|uniref:hypothetical protein n=1 Tax=Bradyrhizobium sp. TaxID=376 RepID=UPI003C4F0882
MPVHHDHWIAHFGRRTPDKVGVVELSGERRFTHAQFDARMIGKNHNSTPCARLLRRSRSAISWPGPPDHAAIDPAWSHLDA